MGIRKVTSPCFGQKTLHSAAKRWKENCDFFVRRVIVDHVSRWSFSGSLSI